MIRVRLFLVLSLLGFGLAAAEADPIAPNRIIVVDGDTIRVDGKRPNVRLIDYNAPEPTVRAQCEAERRLGVSASQRLREIVAAGELDFEPKRCACRPGTEGTKYCNRGRSCGTLKANGEDVGTILVRERLAVAFVCRARGCPPTPRPWCFTSAGQRFAPLGHLCSAGASAVCCDGTCSSSRSRQGTCSHHRGVCQWLRPTSGTRRQLP